MLELRALRLLFDALRAMARELAACLLHVALGHHAGGMARLRDRECTFVGGDRAREQRALRLGGAQGEVGLRQQCLRRQRGGRQVVVAGLQLRGRTFARAGKSAPQIGLPTRGDTQRKLVGCLVARLFGSARRAGGNIQRRLEGRSARIERRTRARDRGQRGFQVLVVDRDARFQAIEHRVLEQRPPRVGDSRVRCGAGPRLFEHGRRRHRRRRFDA